MSGAQKVSLSLLVSVLVFSVLAVLAFADGFRILETRFYIPRVEESVRLRARTTAELYDRFHATNIARFQEFTIEPAVRAAFRINASAAEIRERRNRLDLLDQQLSSLDRVRIIDVAATELHYSSDPSDYTETGAQRVYLRPDQVSADEPISLASLAYYDRLPEVGSLPSGDALPEPGVFLEPTRNQFIYRLPAVDGAGVMQGVMLFYVNTLDLRTAILRAGLMGIGDVVRIVNSDGLIANAPMRFADRLADAAADDWAAIARVDGRRTLTGAIPVPGNRESDEPVRASYEAFGMQSDLGGILVFLEPSASLDMPVLLRYTLLAAVFLTTFLIVFLLLNLRQDAIIVISDRVKRFQIALLREYMENRREVDFRRWKSELEDRREEVQREIRRGIGRVKPAQEEEVDRLINQSWDEIIAVLSSRAEERPSAAIDVDRIEEIVKQLTARFAQMQSASPVSPAAIQAQPPSAPQPVEVEEVDEAKEVDEAEEVDEVEEVDEAEEVDEIEEVDEAEEVDEIEEVDEAEEVDEIEEVDEAEPVVGLDSLDEHAELEWLARSESAQLPGPRFRSAGNGGADAVGDEVAAGGELGEEESPQQEPRETAQESDDRAELVDLETVGLGGSTEYDELPEEVEEVEEVEAELEELEGEAIDTGEPLEMLEAAEAEEPIEAEEEAVVAESLSAAVGATTTFGGALFAFGRGTMGSAAPPRVETLAGDELSRAERDSEAAGRHAEQQGERSRPAAQTPNDGAETAGLIRFTSAREGSTADYEIATIGDVLNRLHVDKGVLLERDGVVEIEREAYGDRPLTKDEELRDLVDSVTNPETDDVRSGIEQLFGDGVDDLLPGARSIGDAEPQEARSAGESVFRFVEQGVDYDAFLRGYQSNDGGVLKSLVRFTRLWGARVGVVFLEDEDGLVPSYQLGLHARCAEAMKITRSSGLYRNVLAKRYALFVRRPLVTVEYFEGLCEPEQLAVLERSLFLPLVFRKERAYVLLGLPRSVDSLDAAFRNVTPHLGRLQRVSP